MPQTDPFIAGLSGAAPPPTTTPTTTAPVNDPFISGLAAKPVVAPAAPATATAVTSTDPFISNLPTSSQASSTGQEAPTSMLGKAWNWANTPLHNFNPENESGVMGGVEDLLSGLFTPLSLGLTAATFGGGAALRGLGLAAEEMPIALKGAQTLLKAGVAADAPEALTALRTAGMAESEIPTAVKGAGALMKAGVTADNASVLDKLVKSSPFLLKSLRDVGVQSEAMHMVVRGMKSLVDAGFTGQAAYQVVQESPRVLDAMKEGRYDDAARLATHVVAGTAMAYFGQRQLRSDLGPLSEDLQVAVGSKLKMSDLTRKAMLADGIRARKIQETNDTAKAVVKHLTDTYKLDPVQWHAVKNIIESGHDPAVMAERFNDIVTSAGKPELKILPKETEFSLGEGKELSKSDENVEGPLFSYPILKSGNQIGVIDIAKQGKNAWIDWVGDEKDRSIDPSGRGALTNEIGFKGIKDLLRQYKKENPEVETVEGLPVGGALSEELRPPIKIPIDRLIGSDKPGTRTPEQQARYSELIAQQHIKNKYTPEQRDFIIGSYQEAFNALRNPESNPVYGRMIAASKEASEHFDRILETAKSNGLVKKGFENYVTNLWKPEDVDHSFTQLLRDDANNNKFMMNISMGKKRTFANSFEGQLTGRILRTGNPAVLLGRYISQMGEAISNRDFREYVLDNLKASDGRPLAALAGAGKVITDNDTGKPLMLLNHESMRNIAIPETGVAELKQNGLFDKYLANELIVKIPHEGKDLYAWNTSGYRDIDSSALEDWNFGARDPKSGLKGLVKSRYMVHPEGYDLLNRLFGAEQSPLRQVKLLNWLLRASTEAKHIMLSFSPFHLAQEGLRAVMTGIDPRIREHMDINDSRVLQMAVEEGMSRGKNHLGLKDFDSSLNEGLGGRSKLVDWVGKQGDKLGLAGKPLSWIRDIQNNTTDFLFERYIPNLKDRAVIALHERWAAKLADEGFFKRLQKQHPEFEGYTADRAAARLAAQEANERFGGINYRQLGRAVGTQDFLRLATLAPDWLESEIRSIKRAFDPTGGVMLRRDLVRLTAIMWTTSRFLNMLLSGKMHNEAPFGVAWTDPDGKEKIYSIRTLPTDMFHAITDPEQFMKGRLSPAFRTVNELYTGRDFQGRKLTHYDTAVDIIRNNFLPIPAQAILKGATGGSPDLTNPDQAAKALGATAQVYRTEAQKLALQLSSNRNETGPVDENQLAKHRAVIELENQIRSGQAPITTLNDLLEQGHISVKEANQVRKNVEETQGMDPEMAGLYTRSSRLPMPDFMKIWDAATPNEHAVLSKLLIKKRNNYNRMVMKDMTPAQRMNDPTYNRLKALFPGQPIF
jgi:hypothetical protein